MADKRSLVPPSVNVVVDNDDLLSTMPSVDVVAENDDLLSTILLFVPGKPVTCMKLVCKRWQSLISAEPFRRLHVLQRRSSDPPPSFIIRANPTCFFHFNPMSKIFRPYDFCFHHPRILQSSYGLLLLKLISPYGAKNDYCVYNPTTAESRNIPIDDSGNDEKETISGLCLAFDPRKSSYYKVVCIRRHKKYPSLRWIEIYNSETRAWNLLEKSFTVAKDANFFNGIYWNNRTYWIRSTNARSYYLDLETGIVRTPQKVLNHKKFGIESQKNYVMESNGRLHYVTLYCQYRKKLFLKVSELLHDLGWFEKYTANLKAVSSEFKEMMSWSEAVVLCIVSGHKEEDSAVCLLLRGRIILYRFCDGYFEDLFHSKEFYRNSYLKHRRGRAYQFVESLVPV